MATKNGNNGNITSGSGVGGDGGIAIDVLATGGVALTNTSALTGGNAGMGTSYGVTGVGIGGYGIKGGNLTLFDSANIAGGVGGTGIQAAAVDFTGGANALTTASGVTLSGGIIDAGSLKLDQTSSVNGVAPPSTAAYSLISGTGSIDVASQTNITLTGTSSYSGGTTIEATGTLNLGNGTNTGSIVGAVTDDGALNITGGSAASTASIGSLSGSGTLSVAANVSTTFTGTSTFSGGTTVSGTLNLAGGTFSGDIANGGTLTFTPASGAPLTLSGVISDGANPGILRALSGTTTLSGVNTYSGGTYLDGGTITAANAGAFGTGTIHAVDPSVTFTTTATQTNNIELDVAAPASSDPTSFIVNSGVTETLSGTITTGSGNNADGKAIDANQPIVVQGPGSLVLSGANSYSGGTSITSGTLDLVQATSAGTGAIAYAATGAATAGLALEANAQPAPGSGLTAGASFGNTLSNFNSTNDSLDLKGFTFGAVTSYVSSGSSLTVMGGASGVQTETFTLSNGAMAFAAQADSAGTGTLITAEVPCYCTGTLVRTARGDAIVDVAVEQLAVGDLVVTASGAHRPIRWLGHRHTDCRSHPRPLEVMPVRISAHALGSDRPARDLWVSPGHAICVDLMGEVLIPASALVNGTTIQQVGVDAVTYWHVELDSHDILLAENLPAESYLDMGNRGFFADAAVVDLAAGPDADTAQRTHADFCRPFHADGAFVAVARMQLQTRLPILGWQLVPTEPWDEVALVVDSRALRPKTRGLTACFELPAGARDIWLTCGTGVPGEVSDSADDRVLGLCLAAITLDDGLGEPRAVALDDALLGEGFHQHQGDHRWTAGRARLPAELLAGLNGTAFLRLALHTPPLPRWAAQEDEDGQEVSRAA